jgi:hypothetical protein
LREAILSALTDEDKASLLREQVKGTMEKKDKLMLTEWEAKDSIATAAINITNSTRSTHLNSQAYASDFEANHTTTQEFPDLSTATTPAQSFPTSNPFLPTPTPIAGVPAAIALSTNYALPVNLAAPLHSSRPMSATQSPRHETKSSLHSAQNLSLVETSALAHALLQPGPHEASPPPHALVPTSLTTNEPTGPTPVATLIDPVKVTATIQTKSATKRKAKDSKTVRMFECQDPVKGTVLGTYANLHLAEKNTKVQKDRILTGMSLLRCIQSTHH